jgi:NADPH:quinone reductase-like Zn-dependent oxidoreductase
MIRAVTYRRSGHPVDVLELTDIAAPPAPGRGQVQLQVSAFPIHPGDLQAVAAARPAAGQIVAAGLEATGVVLAVGEGVSTVAPGTRVTVFPCPGAWREQINVDANLAVVVPDSVSDEVAAQMLVNPITVLMLRRAAQQHFSAGFDGVILNNAAASAVGRLFTAGAEHHQIATISIVRSEQRAQQLRQRFPSVPVVSTATPGWEDRVRQVAGARPIPVVLDPIGGSTAAALLSLLSPGGTLIIYGLMDAESIPLHAADLIESAIGLRGLTIGRWLTAVSPDERASDVASALAMARGFPQQFDTAAIYPLEQITDAVQHVSKPGKVGTVLVKT